MAAINFPTATSNGQTFTADTGVIYTYIGTPPNGFWSGTFGTTGLATLDGRFVALNDGNSIQTMQTQGLKFNNGSADTILLDGVNGKVGVGTTSPSVPLTVSSASDHSDIAIFHAGGGTPNRGLKISTFSNTNANAGVEFDAQTSTGAFKFSTGGNERMRIASSGNVGIGTTSADANLHIKGSYPTVHIERDHATNYSRLILDNTANDGGAIDGIGDGVGGLRFSTSDAGTITERMRISSSGNVGIGTTDPDDVGNFSKALDVSGASGASVLVRNNNSATNCGIFGYFGTSTYVINRAAGPVLFYVSNTEKMRIDSSGDIELYSGSTNESYRVFRGKHSPGNEFNRSEVRFGVENNANGLGFLALATGNNTASERMRIDSSGKVGIGTTSPSANLHGSVSSGAYSAIFESTATSGEASLVIGGKNSSGTVRKLALKYDSADVFRIATAQAVDIRFETNDTERMRIDSSGNLLINKSTTGTRGANAPLQIKSGASAWGINLSCRSNNDYSYFTFTSHDSNESLANILVQRTGTSTADLAFSTNNGTTGAPERMRIDSSGRLLVGTTASIPVNGANCAVQVEGTNSDTSRISVINRGNHSGGGGIQIAKSRGTTPALVQDDDQVGGVFFCAGDGSDFVSQAARIECYIDGAPSGSDTPGRLTFSTTPDQTDSPVERMTIDSSGNVGIGTTPNSDSQLHVKSGANDNNPILRLEGATNNFLNFRQTGSVYDINVTASDPLSFTIGATERMRIDSSGNLLVGKTGSNFAVQGVEIRGSGEITLTRQGDLLTTRRITTEGTHMSIRSVGGTVIGTISTNGTATSYNTNSDYRLKENVVDLVAAIPRLKTLPVYRFNFIGSDKTVDGFIAHEAQLVIPEAVSGTHNEIDGDGNPIMQSIDQAKVVPLVTAALQEAIGRIETLEAEIAALKAG